MSDNPGQERTAADDPQPARSPKWIATTVVSMVLGLALAGLMTASMFAIGEYYRGSGVSQWSMSQRLAAVAKSAAKSSLRTLWTQ